MKIPDEIYRLALFWGWVLVELGIRGVYYVARDSRISWGNGVWVPEQVFIAWPKWIAPTVSTDCLVPDAGGSPPAKRWCLPDSTPQRRVQLKKLDELIASLKTKGLPGATAPELGVYLQVMTFNDLTLINPRIISQKDASHCFIREDGKEVTMPYFKQVRADSSTDMGRYARAL